MYQTDPVFLDIFTVNPLDGAVVKLIPFVESPPIVNAFVDAPPTCTTNSFASVGAYGSPKNVVEPSAVCVSVVVVSSYPETD